MKPLVTLKVEEAEFNKIQEFYEPYSMPNDGEYVSFYAEHNGVNITGFSSKKKLKTITFLGDNALEEARLFDINAEIKEVKEKEKASWINLENQIGSDEVGVGDFLLPMIVVAAFVRKKDIKTLKEFNVTDSKKLKDEDIRQMGELLAKKFFLSRLTLDNEKYNEMVDKGENLN
nr:DUF3378 domain-containing protein [Bacilli bacterium]